MRWRFEAAMLVPVVPVQFRSSINYTGVTVCAQGGPTAIHPTQGHLLSVTLENYMKFAHCFLAALIVLPAVASPTTYNLTFTGGFYLSPEGPVHPFAPQSGSFTYDPNSGFSGFTIQYDHENFDLTASANAPTVCDSSGLNCSPGNPSDAFTSLTENATWLSYESFSGTNIVTNFVLSPYEDSTIGTMSATAPGFPGFSPGQADLVRSGSFTMANGTGPGTATPEPGSARMLSIFGGVGLVFIVWARRRSRSKASLN